MFSELISACISLNTCYGILVIILLLLCIIIIVIVASMTSHNHQTQRLCKQYYSQWSLCGMQL